MAFKDKKWVEVKKNGLKLELIIKDQDWKKIATIKCTSKEFPNVCSDIERRFGIPIKKKEISKEVEEELGFLKQGLNW